MTEQEDQERQEPQGEGSRGSGCGAGRRRRRHHHGRRKERVLHTRISEQLSDDIKRLAEDMRVPVSNLVRNILEEVFTAVENVSDDVGEFFEDVVDEAEGVRERIRKQQWTGKHDRWSSRARRHSGSEDVEQELRADEAADRKGHQRATPPEPAPRSARPDESTEDVLGWQSIVLNRALHCPDCGSEVPSGGAAHLGILASGKPGRIVCGTCAGAN